MGEGGDDMMSGAMVTHGYKKGRAPLTGALLGYIIPRPSQEAGLSMKKNFIGFYSDLRLFTGFSFDATAVRFHGFDAPFRVII